jgi:hypothetical protein
VENEVVEQYLQDQGSWQLPLQTAELTNYNLHRTISKHLLMDQTNAKIFSSGKVEKFTY